MRRFTRKLDRRDGAIGATLTLPFGERRRSRFRAQLETGEEVGVVLERGIALRDGDVLADDAGGLIQIRAAAERVSTVRCDDPTGLARACYHLGNRHVPLQIGAGFARYQHDHVLDEMVIGLGLSVAVETAPFEPEGGAYGGGHRHHDHGDEDSE